MRALAPLLRRVRSASRSDATPYSVGNVLGETGYASAADYGALHGAWQNRLDGLADDMSAARYGTPDDAPPALPASDIAAATAAHMRCAPRARRAA